MKIPNYNKTAAININKQKIAASANSSNYKLKQQQNQKIINMKESGMTVSPPKAQSRIHCLALKGELLLAPSRNVYK